VTTANMDPMSQTPSLPKLAAAARSPYGGLTGRPGPQVLGAPGLGHVAAGTRRRLVVLCSQPTEAAAIDLETRALVRARAPRLPRMRPYQVVRVQLAEDHEVPDPAAPEGVVLARPPEPDTPVRARHLRRLLKDLLSPPGEPLLGFPGAAVPYWTLTGAWPSVALIRPDDDLSVLVRRGEMLVRAAFSWGGLRHHLPVYDFAAATALATALSGRSRLERAGVEAALGFRPEYLVVSLTPPQDGQCYKTVGGLLPRP